MHGDCFYLNIHSVFLLFIHSSVIMFLRSVEQLVIHQWRNFKFRPPPQKTTAPAPSLSLVRYSAKFSIVLLNLNKQVSCNFHLKSQSVQNILLLHAGRCYSARLGYLSSRPLHYRVCRDGIVTPPVIHIFISALSCLKN